MNVAEFKRSILPGDCIVIKDLSNSVVSDGIEWFTGGEVSHVAVVFDEDRVIEALAIQGVSVSPLSQYFDDRYKIWVRRLPEDLDYGSEVAEFCWFKAGNRYDFSQVILDGIALMAGKLGLDGFKAWFGRKVFGWRDGWTCSELFSQAVWEKAGINVYPKKDVRAHTPQDLLESPLLETVFFT